MYFKVEEFFNLSEFISRISNHVGIQASLKKLDLSANYNHDDIITQLLYEWSYLSTSKKHCYTDNSGFPACI